MIKEEKHGIVPKWLQELQHKSWEPEILLSGIVLYGMFKVPDLLDDFLAFFKLNVFGNSQDIDNLVALFKMGIYWLIGGLILHLICRGIWIGMVGLSYTFPEGIRKEELNYQSKFKDKMNHIPSYEKIVIRLEKVCSSLFSISFMLFMSLIGGYLYFFVLIIIPFTFCYLVLDLGFEGTSFDVFEVYVLVVVGVGLVGLLDFVSLGYFRRFKYFTKVYWPVHKFISALTLSRFYRPIYYGVVTHFNKWAFFVFLLFFTIISIAGAGSITDTNHPGDPYSQLTLWGNGQGYVVYSGNYDDQNQDNPSIRAHIPSDIITGDVLKVFVVANIVLEESMMEFTSLDSLQEIYPDTSSLALKLMVIDAYYEVQIDGAEIDVESWFFNYKERTSQRGFVAYLDISHLAEGQHQLVLFRATGGNIPYATIPFYKDITYLTTSKAHPEAKKESVDFQSKPFRILE